MLGEQSVAFKQRCPGATSSSLPPGAAAARRCGGGDRAPIFAPTWNTPSPSRSPGRRIFFGRHEDLIFLPLALTGATVRETCCLHSLRGAPPPRLNPYGRKRPKLAENSAEFGRRPKFSRRPIWTISNNFGQFRPISADFSRFRTISDDFGRFRTISDDFG